MRARSGKVSIVSLLLLVAALAGGVAVNMLYEPYITYFKMKEITKSVLLDWHGLNLSKGKRRLPEEFVRQEIPEYITEDNCTFEDAPPEKIFHCEWEVDAYYPFSDYYKTLRFRTYASHDGVSVYTE